MSRRLPMICVAFALAASACGDEEPRVNIRSVAVPVDCTPSVRGDQGAWATQVAGIAADVLPRGRVLHVGCFYGEKQGVHWLPAYDPRRLPRVTGGGGAQAEYARRYGLALASTFRKTFVPHDERGTNWLGALLTAARVDQVEQIYLFSDLVQQAAGVHLTQPISRAGHRRIVRRWARRLGGLRDVDVIALGAGEGVARSQAAVRGERLLNALAKAVPFRLEYKSLVVQASP